MCNVGDYVWKQARRGMLLVPGKPVFTGDPRVGLSSPDFMRVAHRGSNCPAADTTFLHRLRQSDRCVRPAPMVLLLAELRQFAVVISGDDLSASNKPLNKLRTGTRRKPQLVYRTNKILFLYGGGHSYLSRFIIGLIYQISRP